tara:strand:+ start:4174 stop:4437 length:264 start_codon:yes stop_codon:yes gene_type:complete
MSGAALVTSLVLAVIGALLSYAVRTRDTDTERRLVHVEALSARTAHLETRAAVNERDLTHMRDDLTAIRTNVAELLRLTRERQHDTD